MSIPHSKLASVCSHTFADGRQCRTPRASRQSGLCLFHFRKAAEAEARRKIGHEIGTWVTADFVSASDLSHALGFVFSETLQGNITPKTATSIAYLGQTMLQTIKAAEHEFCQAHGADSWRRAIRHNTPDPTRKPAPPVIASAHTSPQPADSSANVRQPGDAA